VSKSSIDCEHWKTIKTTKSSKIVIATSSTCQIELNQFKTNTETYNNPYQEMTNIIRDEEISKFLNKEIAKDDYSNICVRFIRKKFQCIIIILLSLISLFELFNSLILKLDEASLSYLIMKLFENNQSIAYPNNESLIDNINDKFEI
jgi:hypothetical protein